MAAARQIHEELGGRGPEIPASIRMNQVITDMPFPPGTIHAHLDSSSGVLEIDSGHLDSPDLTVTMDYDTARAILVEGDAQAAMAAFLGGRIKVDGDITKLLALQAAAAPGVDDPAAAEVFGRLREITA